MTSVPAAAPEISRATSASAVEPGLALNEYAAAFEAWLAVHEIPDVITAATPSQEQRITAMCGFMRTLWDAGWSRYGWPEAVGGSGGTIAHRAAMWSALARHGARGMEQFEHLEVLIPTLVAHGTTEFVSQALPAYLSGDELWSQGFSEPEAGSDLASLRTTATATDDGFVVTGRKIWTSWAPWARWCLVLARTGPADSRHRGLTALVVDLHDPGVGISAIAQANGNAELAEVTFDAVPVPRERMVGELNGGWAVAMHILSHERGTFAWFRHAFLYHHMFGLLAEADPVDDGALGNALLDLVAVTATSQSAIEAHAGERPLGPKAAFTKLALCAAEQSVNDWALAADPGLALVGDGETALRRQEYLFSRIVTVYGGSQQMQLDTIAKQILRLP